MNTKSSIVTSAADGCGNPSSIRSMDNSNSSGIQHKEFHMFTKRISVSHIFSLAAAVAAAGTAYIGLPAAHANLLAYEPFNYAVGSSLAGQTPASPGGGFTGGWTTPGGTATINSGSLIASSSYGGYATSAPSLASTGNSVAITGGGPNTANINLASPITATAASPIWYSFLVNPTQNWSVLTLAPANICFGASSGNWSIGVIGTSVGQVNSGTATSGTSYLVVLEDQGPTTTGGKDTLSLWVDPNPGATAPSELGVANGAPILTDPNLTVGTVTQLQLATGQSGVFDELRIGTSYADVTPVTLTSVPDPATLCLFAIGGLGLIAMRYRKTMRCGRSPAATR